MFYAPKSGMLEFASLCHIVLQGFAGVCCSLCLPTPFWSCSLIVRKLFFISLLIMFNRAVVAYIYFEYLLCGGSLVVLPG